MDLDKLRFFVKDCIQKHLYDSAIFFSDKLVTVSCNASDDLYLLAQSYFLGKHYRRALHVLQSHNLLSKNAHCLYLAAKCLTELKLWKECIDLLSEFDIENLSAGYSSYIDTDDKSGGIKVDSALCYLNGKCYEELGNRIKAKQWYISSLQIDPFCYESFQRLINYHLLSVEEEKTLLNSLNFNSTDSWLSVFYSMQSKQFQENMSPEEIITLLDTVAIPELSIANEFSTNSSLSLNNDVLLCKAETFYQKAEFDQCFRLTSKILENDPYHLQCMPYHIASAVELKQKNVLFLQAHKLVNEYPNSKSTQIEEAFVYSWIGFGLAYSAQDELDQSITAYRTASRFFPGCHIPYLYMAIDYRRSNNLNLAEEFLHMAKTICSFDPLTFNELGIVAFANNDFDAAETNFRTCLDLVSKPLNEVWAPTLVNLAHSLRKKKKYGEAIEMYEKALSFSPKCSSIFSSMGFTHHLMGKTDIAADYYHKALALKPKDSFLSDLLFDALKEECTRFADL